MTSRILTGITTTGTPHLGNYAGAIRPAIEASRAPGVESFYFLADYHALIKCDDAARIEQSRMAVAATWLAAGLDPNKVTFYRQSDIPEIPELTWLLTCVAGKGLLNRAHAYKGAVDKNQAEGEDADAGITMGLFSYPILMAADILMFNADQVPVGRDQLQHVEMARDIGQRFNHVFGKGRSYFNMPQALIDERVALLPGLDGRKMSKSYNNTIPLFARSKELRESIQLIVTDSRLPGERKDPDSSALFTLFKAFATPERARMYHEDLIAGLGWGEAKKQLFELVDNQLGGMRQQYHVLLTKPKVLEDILQYGAQKAREVAAPFLGELREAVGLKSFNHFAPKVEAVKKPASGLSVISFREQGAFHFRVLGADKQVLMTSIALADGKEMGAIVSKIKAGDMGDLRNDGNTLTLWHEGRAVAHSETFADRQGLNALLKRLADDLYTLREQGLSL